MWLEIYVKNMLYFAASSYRGQRGEVRDDDRVLQVGGGDERRKQCEGPGGVVFSILLIYRNYKGA